MSRAWQAALARWTGAGLVDAATAERIRDWEAAQPSPARGRLALLAFGFGGLLTVAGVLLFVASHWDRLPPGGRFALVLAMVAVFHVGGALAARAQPALATTLHAIGTGALGAGIYLSGQIFHMAEHWPGALMLWSLGAAAGLLLLRDWPQALWLAMLAPAWLWGEWMEAWPGDVAWGRLAPAATGLFVLACAYLFARDHVHDTPWRRALSWLGAVMVIPAALGLLHGGNDYLRSLAPEGEPGADRLIAFGWAVAVLLPITFGWAIRRRADAPLVAAVAWAALVTQVDSGTGAGELAIYALYALGAAGLVLWGVRDGQPLAVNVGTLGFALTVGAFYFSSLFDKLGRALGLIGAGLLLIVGGWLLERARRSLVGRIGKPS